MLDVSITKDEPSSGLACCGGNGMKDVAQPDNDEADTALAREMNKLSVQERERVFDDMHGVAPVQEETPDFVTGCLEAMDLALSLLAKVKRRALDRALFFKPSIETDKKFKLMFLRADAYDPRKAAKRMAKYFEEKLILFGEAKLTKRITLDDLTLHDIRQLNLVGCVVLPNTDQVGRPILFFDVERYDWDNLDSMYRCFWYQVMTTMENETAQLKGICDVAYCPGDLLAMPASIQKVSQMMQRSGAMMEGLPLRITTFQFCYTDKRMRYILSIMPGAFGKNVRFRVRAHFGSDLEMQYSLMTFGIFCHYLFHSAEDDGRRELVQRQHIQRRREIERKAEEADAEEETRSDIILQPGPHDVLVGRGRPYQEYIGNQRLSRLVESHSERYRNMEDRFEKSCILLEIVKTVRDSNGRFLQKTAGGWKVASDKVAREKTCSAFRSKVGKANQSDVMIKQPFVADHAQMVRSSKRIRYDPAVPQFAV
eukprot:CAMPEP_0117013002 /NCGR_PEP_ID=MMETSP0472-20121206/10810_1 /TAXON_ID=693140 ORGANISM="Tiarina fusus, Strain LIS" /NCGR_SAMPLE_ID=MMETSP0472 /ASSEMBLY_ACC=CAM_ASM_000603 /LENGTH=482 /DNA_ID=CAMNT_0004716191 /DNA_START=113 /DNA_END=1561 /DNA_ORIENTATION=+